MKKAGMKSTAILLTGALAALSFTACGSEEQTVSQVREAEETAAVSEGTYTAQPAASAKADQKDKEETVRVKADASGNTTEITVEEILKNDTYDEKIEDYTYLTDIINTEGDEEYESGSDGEIFWENHGENIHYKGNSEKELPVDMHITYYLDDQEMTPEEIAGQSGHVRVRVDFTNNTGETVNVDGEDIDVQVPFSAVSLFALPQEQFSNIEIESGGSMSMSGQTILYGIGMTGLEDLELSELLEDFDGSSDAGVNDYIEFTADTDCFEIDYSATVISNGLFADMSEESVDSLEEMSDAINSLEGLEDDLTGFFNDFSDELTKELTTFFDELESSLTEAFAGINTYIQGINQVLEAQSRLSAGVSTMAEASDGINTSLQGLKSLSSAVVEAVNAGTAQEGSAEEGSAEAGSEQASVGDILSGMQEKLNALKTEAESAEAALNETATAKAREQAEAAVKEKLADSEMTQEQIEEIASAVGQSISITDLTVGYEESLDEIIAQVEALKTAISDADNSAQLLQLKEMLNQMNTYIDSISAGFTQFNDGQQQLAAAYAQLGAMTPQLIEAGNTIAAGLGSTDISAEDYDLDSDSLSMDEFSDKYSSLKEGDLGDKYSDVDTEKMLKTFKAIKEADARYINYGGIKEGKTGSSTMIVQTEKIEK